MKSIMNVINKMENQTCFSDLQEEILEKSMELEMVDNFLNHSKSNYAKEAEKIYNKHCVCCRFNPAWNSNEVNKCYVEWAFYNRYNKNKEENILGEKPIIGTICSQSTFQNLITRWLNGDIGSTYKEMFNENKLRLKGIYLTKLQFEWNTDDWYLFDGNINTKVLNICNFNQRFKIKFVVSSIQ